MELKKELGFLDVFSISSGAMISSGIFILPGLAFSKAGPAMILAYFLGGVIAFLGILSVIELTTAMPKAGGDYFFIKRAMGPLTGTVSGMLSWFAISLKTAFAIFGIAGVINTALYGHHVTALNMMIASFLVTVFFVVLNIIGVDLASKFEVALVVVLLTIMTVYIGQGIGNLDGSSYAPFIQTFKKVGPDFVEGEAYEFFSVKGIGTLLSTTAFIFVSFGGLLKAASISEEVKDPGKNIVLGLIGSIGVITIYYTLMLVVTVGRIDDITLANSLTPIADAAHIFSGSIGYYSIITASMLAFVSTANAGIMAASRYPLAMARDNLIPDRFSRINERTKTPAFSIIVTGIFICVSLMLPLEYLAKTASSVILLAYILTNLCVLILRESNIKNYRPTFKVKFYPWIQCGVIVTFSYFILSLGFMPIFLCFILAVGSLFMYIFYGSKKYSGEYALLHLLLRVTKNINVEHHLEEELRDIIHEREDVKLDHFDLLVKESNFIDVNRLLTLEELFKIEADYLTEDLKISKEELIDLFRKREEQSCTAINHFTAIPHVVIDREDIFKMVVVRCSEGVNFGVGSERVKAVFLFVSGKNLSRQHLQTLASIASIVKNEDFEEKWLEAENENYLKDLILLSERKRFDKR